MNPAEKQASGLRKVSFLNAKRQRLKRFTEKSSGSKRSSLHQVAPRAGARDQIEGLGGGVVELAKVLKGVEVVNESWP